MPWHGIACVWRAIESPCPASAACFASDPLVAVDSEPLDVEGRFSVGHDIGHDPRTTGGHRPAHVALPCIEIEILHPAATQDGRSVWCHGPEAGPVAGLVIG